MTNQATAQKARHKFLDNLPLDDADARLDLIRQRLLRLHEPVTASELITVDEMAQAWNQLWQLDRKKEVHYQLQRRGAWEQFGLDEHKAFVKLVKTLKKNPAALHAALGQSFYGCTRLAQGWETLEEFLNEGLGLDLLMMRDALHAEGLSERIQEMNEQSWWLMVRYIATRDDAEQAIHEWIAFSGIKARERVFYQERILKQMAHAPDAATARAQLLEQTQNRRQHWLCECDRARADYDRRREEFSQSVQASPYLVSSLRTLNSFERYEETRLARLRKELTRLQEKRHREEARLARQAEKGRKSGRTGAKLSAKSNLGLIHDATNKNQPQYTAEGLIKKAEAAYTETPDPSPENDFLPPELVAEAQSCFAQWTDADLVDFTPEGKIFQRFGHLKAPNRIRLLKLMNNELTSRMLDQKLVMT